MEEARIMPLTYVQEHLLIKPWVRRFPTSAMGAWFWKDVIIEPHSAVQRGRMQGVGQPKGRQLATKLACPEPISPRSETLGDHRNTAAGPAGQRSRDPAIQGRPTRLELFSNLDYNSQAGRDAETPPAGLVAAGGVLARRLAWTPA